MAHQANPTHLPPPKSPREYEAEIARLKDELESAHELIDTLVEEMDARGERDE